MTTLLQIAVAGLAVLSFTPGASAQKCRVHCTAGHGSGTVYKEVYEYDYVTQKPTFPGGQAQLVSYINNTRHYPRRAYERGIQGRVTLSFVIEADGSVSNIAILKGVEESLNREAVRIIANMPNWQPGRLNGHPVPVRVIQTVPFRK